MFEARDSTHVHVVSPGRSVESRVESVLWKEDGRVALVENAYFSLKRGCGMY